MAETPIAATIPRRSRAGRVLGAVMGAFLLPSAIALLAWNEMHGSDRERALAEGAGLVREAPADRPDPALDGQLVHVSGPLRVPGTLADPDLGGVRAPPGAVQLRRLVQTYQWQERSSRGSRSYVQVWSDEVIDSTRFQQPGGPQNPPPRYRALRIVAPEAFLGGYRLTEPLLRELGGAEPLVVSPDAAADPSGLLPSGLHPSNLRPFGLHPYGSGLYLGGNPDAPQVGDQRLTWEVVRPSSASVVARLQGAGFAPYRAASGGIVHEIAAGILPAGEMIASAEQANAFLTGLLRATGTGLLFLGFFLLLRARPAPALGGRGPALAGVMLTAIAAPAVIAAAWLASGALAAAGLLALGPVLVWFLTRRARPRA